MRQKTIVDVISIIFLFLCFTGCNELFTVLPARMASIFVVKLPEGYSHLEVLPGIERERFSPGIGPWSICIPYSTDEVFPISSSGTFLSSSLLPDRERSFDTYEFKLHIIPDANGRGFGLICNNRNNEWNMEQIVWDPLSGEHLEMEEYGMVDLVERAGQIIEYEFHTDSRYVFVEDIVYTIRDSVTTLYLLVRFRDGFDAGKHVILSTPFAANENLSLQVYSILPDTNLLEQVFIDTESGTQSGAFWNTGAELTLYVYDFWVDRSTGSVAVEYRYGSNPGISTNWGILCFDPDPSDPVPVSAVLMDADEKMLGYNDGQLIASFCDSADYTQENLRLIDQYTGVRHDYDIPGIGLKLLFVTDEDEPWYWLGYKLEGYYYIKEIPASELGRTE